MVVSKDVHDGITDRRVLVAYVDFHGCIKDETSQEVEAIR